MDNKFAVFGPRTHDGRIVAFPVSRTDAWTLQNAVLDNVKPGSMVYTDGHPAYTVLAHCGYGHQRVNHSVCQYVSEVATTNGIESFWALLKRGYVGPFHYMSWKHLHRYVAEFCFRHNIGTHASANTLSSRQPPLYIEAYRFLARGVPDGD